MPPTSQRLPGAHGLALQLYEWPGVGPPVVLLHGFGMSARVWEPSAEALAPRRRVLAFDARGHGDSDRDPEFRYSHAAVALDLAALVDALALERFALVGHSMGGYASIRYAARQPERVERLVLVDAGPELSAASRAGRAAERPDASPSFASPDAYAALLARLHPRADPAILAALAPHWLRRRDDGRFEPKLDPAFARPRSARDPANRRGFDRPRWAREEGARLWRWLEQIPCPTLVLRGAESPLLSAETAEHMVRRSLPDARAVSIPGAGHAVMLDAPDAFRTALLEFLLEPQGSAASRRPWARW